jgi:hypothetical protein
MAHRWDTAPEILAFRKAARDCYLAGEAYRELKDILATEDELTKPERARFYKTDAADADGED